MSNCNIQVCYFCRASITKADHIAVDEEGEPVCMCDSCFKLASIFFKNRRKQNAGREEIPQS
jgi:hypothetical protein